jgi:hypothetical protein
MGSNAHGPLARTAAGQSLGRPWSSTRCAWRNYALRRILADHRTAQLGVSAGTVRHAYSQTAVSKPLEQSPPPAMKRYDLLAREEAGLKSKSAGCGNQALVPSVHAVPAFPAAAGPSSTALAQSGIRVFLWRRPVKDELSKDTFVLSPRCRFLLESQMQSESAVGVRLKTYWPF